MSDHSGIQHLSSLQLVESAELMVNRLRYAVERHGESWPSVAQATERAGMLALMVLELEARARRPQRSAVPADLLF